MAKPPVDKNLRLARRIAQRIKTQARTRHWSLRRLGRETDIPASTLSDIMRAQAVPQSDVLWKIARRCDVPMDYFFCAPADLPAVLGWKRD